MARHKAPTLSQKLIKGCRREFRRIEKRISRLQKEARRLAEKEARLTRSVNPYPVGTDAWHQFNLKGRNWGHIQEVRENENGMEAVCYLYAPDSFVLSESAQKWVELNRDFLATLSEQTGVPEAMLGDVEIPEGAENLFLSDG